MKGMYKSVSELLRLISLDQFLVNKLYRYLGARLFMDLYTILVVSSFIISSIEGHSNLDSSGEIDAS